MITRTIRRSVTVAAGVVVGLTAALAVALPASAHVTVDPTTAPAGGYTRVAFRVPNESETANTYKVSVYLPTDHPVATVSVLPVPGWTAVVHKGKLPKPIKTDDGMVTEAIDQITWTAGEGSSIKQNQFQEFPVELGPLPKQGEMIFRALQYYSDNTLVRWIETPVGGVEVQHPAPIIKIGGSTSGTANNASSGAKAQSGGGGSGTALGVGAAGLLVGVIGLIVGGMALVRTRRPAAAAGGAGTAPVATGGTPPAASSGNGDKPAASDEE